MEASRQRIEELEAENRALRAQLAVCSESARQNELVLVSEKERLQALGDNFPDGTLFRFRMDMCTGMMSFEYMSGTWEAVTGIAVEVCKADIGVVFDRIAPIDLKRLLVVIDRSASTMCNVNLEVRYYHPSGRMMWMQIASHPHREGDIVYSDGFILNVTTRKHTEQALLSEKNRLQALGDNFPDGALFCFGISDSMLTDSNEPEDWLRHLKLAYASAGWEKLSNMSQSDAMRDATQLFKKIHPDDLATIRPLMYESLCRCSTFYAEIRYLFAENDMRWLRIAAQPNREDDWVMSHGLILDITKSKRTEDELAHYREELEDMVYLRTGELQTANAELTITNQMLAGTNAELSVYHSQLEQMVEKKTSQQGLIIRVLQIAQTSQSIPEALPAILSEAGSYAGVSRACIFQKDPSGFLVSNTYEWCCPDIISAQAGSQQIPSEGWYDVFERGEYICVNDTDVLQPNMPELLARRKCRSFLAIPLAASGNHYGVVSFDECNIARKWEKSEIDLYVGLSQIITNIIRRHRAERDLIQAKEKAEESDRLKSAFLANMSHEIRTPLNAITGFLGLMDDEMEPQYRREYTDIINKSAGQLTKLIDNIVDAAKIEACQMQINPAPCHLNRLMEEMFALFETWLKTSQKPHTVMIIDRSGFIASCVCLIDARRLRQILAGLVDNAIKFLDKGYVCFGYRRVEPNLLEFTVDDSGIGIPQSQLSVIFESFRKVERDDIISYGGTGLGLSISRSLARMMGGDMYVESTEGIGATFRFTVAFVPTEREEEYHTGNG